MAQAITVKGFVVGANVRQLNWEEKCGGLREAPEGCRGRLGLSSGDPRTPRLVSLKSPY